jgi:hypothetical protein
MQAVKTALSKVPKPVDSRRVHSGELQEQASSDGHHLLMPLSLELSEK